MTLERTTVLAGIPDELRAFGELVESLNVDDLRTPSRCAGLRCAIHHVGGYLDHQHWGSATLTLNGIERIDIGGGGSEITGDPLVFVFVATGRGDPSGFGLDRSIDVYADQKS
ncbi:MAG: hypothetical protein WAM97_06305 [Acidimicrobiales bacterium]|jgi:hypothetical protein